jgi:hypothetical protein
MSYSTAVIKKPEDKLNKNRKLSANIVSKNFDNSFYKFHTVKKSQCNNTAS